MPLDFAAPCWPSCGGIPRDWTDRGGLGPDAGSIRGFMRLRWAIRSAWRASTAGHHLTPRRPPGPPRLGHQGGITVVELCVDMMLVAILGLSAIELTSQYLESGWVRTAAEQVVGALQQARQYAIANAATYTVTFTGSSLVVACTAGCQHLGVGAGLARPVEWSTPGSALDHFSR